MKVLRGSEGEEEEEEEWEEAEEGVEVEEVEEDEEEEELSHELQQLAEMELGETEQVRNNSLGAIFFEKKLKMLFFSGSHIRAGENAVLA